jgi:hypothetical protein
VSPADGFRYPVSTVQQLRRVNRLGNALWAHREMLGSLLRGRVEVQVFPYQDDAQIVFHVHAPAELEDATALVDALGFEPSKAVRHGRTLQHYWYGEFEGFRGRVVWVEHDRSRDTEGRDPLPAGVGVGDQYADRFYREAEQARAGVRLALGDVEQPAPRFAARPADDDMPPAPTAVTLPTVAVVVVTDDRTHADRLLDDLHAQVPYGRLS